MSKALPFTALQVFESVVRLRGFGRAADELGISQSAVSQHVRALEEWTGRKLLIRGPRRSTATEHGQILADAVAEGVGRISDATRQLRQTRKLNKTIVVSCLPGFAVNWLFPKLLNFDQSHPDLSVSISSNAELVTFANEEADVAIRYGLGGYSGLHVERLMGERVFPVCAPSLLTSGPPLKTVSDLAQHTMLIDEIADIGSNPPNWGFWAQETDVKLPKPMRTRRFGQSNMVVQAAVRGFGVALGREPLVIDALSDGSLVRPFPQTAVSQFAYWFVCPKQGLKSARIRDFRDWLHSEVAAQPDMPVQKSACPELQKPAGSA